MHHTKDEMYAAEEGGAGFLSGLVVGGVIGLLVGLIPALLILYIYGAERGIKALALTVPIATFTTGLLIGLVKAKREWK